MEVSALLSLVLKINTKCLERRESGKMAKLPAVSYSEQWGLETTMRNLRQVKGSDDKCVIVCVGRNHFKSYSSGPV